MQRNGTRMVQLCIERIFVESAMHRYTQRSIAIESCTVLAPIERELRESIGAPNVYRKKGVKEKLNCEKNFLNWKNFEWGTEGVYDVPIGGNGGSIALSTYNFKQ